MSTYLNELDDTVPLNSAKLRTAITELQTMKGSFLDSFPNLRNAVLATQAQLNRAAGLTSSAQTQIDTVDTSRAAYATRGDVYVFQGKPSTDSYVKPNGFTLSALDLNTRFRIEFPNAITSAAPTPGSDSYYYSAHFSSTDFKQIPNLTFYPWGFDLIFYDTNPSFVAIDEEMLRVVPDQFYGWAHING